MVTARAAFAAIFVATAAADVIAHGPPVGEAIVDLRGKAAVTAAKNEGPRIANQQAAAATVAVRGVLHGASLRGVPHAVGATYMQKGDPSAVSLSSDDSGSQTGGAEFGSGSEPHLITVSLNSALQEDSYLQQQPGDEAGSSVNFGGDSAASGSAPEPHLITVSLNADLQESVSVDKEGGTKKTHTVKSNSKAVKVSLDNEGGTKKIHAIKFISKAVKAKAKDVHAGDDPKADSPHYDFGGDAAASAGSSEPHLITVGLNADLQESVSADKAGGKKKTYTVKTSSKAVKAKATDGPVWDAPKADSSYFAAPDVSGAASDVTGQAEPHLITLPLNSELQQETIVDASAAPAAVVAQSPSSSAMDMAAMSPARPAMDIAGMSPAPAPSPAGSPMGSPASAPGAAGVADGDFTKDGLPVLKPTRKALPEDQAGEVADLMSGIANDVKGVTSTLRGLASHVAESSPPADHALAREGEALEAAAGSFVRRSRAHLEKLKDAVNGI